MCQPTWRGGVARPRSDDLAANTETCCRLAGEERLRPAGPRPCSQTSWVFLTWFCYLLLGQVSDCFRLLDYVNSLLTRVSSVSIAAKGKHRILFCIPHYLECLDSFLQHVKTPGQNQEGLLLFRNVCGYCFLSSESQGGL